MKKQFSLIGHPVSHSLSPILHTEVFRQLGVDAQYSAIDVNSEELQEVIKRLKSGQISGINVTIPHKTAIMEFLDEINIKAKQIDAVNCIVNKNDKLIGYNTDWFGFSMLLQKNGLSVQDKTVIVLGAGGVSRSVIYTLLREGVGIVVIVNRTIERANKLVQSFESINKSSKLMVLPIEDISPHLMQDTIIVNCTSVGMTPNTNESQFAENLVNEHHTLIDTIYTPLDTQFLRYGKTAGASIINGLDMFIYQGLASLNLWLGEPVSELVNFKQIKQRLLDNL